MAAHLFVVCEQCHIVSGLLVDTHLHGVSQLKQRIAQLSDAIVVVVRSASVDVVTKLNCHNRSAVGAFVEGVAGIANSSSARHR